MRVRPMEQPTIWPHHSTCGENLFVSRAVIAWMARMFLVGGVADHYLEVYPAQTLTLTLNLTLTLDPETL